VEDHYNLWFVCEKVIPLFAMRWYRSTDVSSHYEK
jgi:hypothetical protein